MANLMSDMIRDLAERGVEKATAVKAMRSLSLYFGGQQLYLPKKLEGSELAEELYGAIADAVGDSDASIIYDIISTLYGGYQWYVPIEKFAFKNVIAKEIFAEYDGTSRSMRDLCRKYGVSFMQVYRLYQKGFELENKAQQEFNF